MPAERDTVRIAYLALSALSTLMLGMLLYFASDLSTDMHTVTKMLNDHLHHHPSAALSERIVVLEIQAHQH